MFTNGAKEWEKEIGKQRRHVVEHDFHEVSFPILAG
jgi:hypothetical protein